MVSKTGRKLSRSRRSVLPFDVSSRQFDLGFEDPAVLAIEVANLEPGILLINDGQFDSVGRSEYRGGFVDRPATDDGLRRDDHNAADD